MTPILLRPLARSASVVVFAAIVCTGAVGVVQAEERSPPQRQALLDLAFVLGESHALRQLCSGEGDQYWRMRMQGLLTAEAPDTYFDRGLKQAFNRGYAAAQTAYPSCGPESRDEESRVAQHGQQLVSQIAR